MKAIINYFFVWLFSLILFSVNNVFAQKIIDSTTDSELDGIHISDMIKLREALLYDDSVFSQNILKLNNFKKIDSCANCFMNEKLGSTIEFIETPVKGIPMKDTYNNKHVLIYRGKSKEFEKDLEGFVRLQKVNENLSVDEYEDELLIGFFDIYLERRFFVNLHENNYCLVVF